MKNQRGNGRSRLVMGWGQKMVLMQEGKEAQELDIESVCV